MKNRWIYAVCILLILAVGCSKAPETRQPVVLSSQASPTPSKELTAATPAPAASVTLAVQRGPGDFDLAVMDTGLGDLPRYQAVLRLAFDGTREGQPYRTEKTFTQIVDRDASANLLKEAATHADGSSAQVFSAVVGKIRYGQPAPDQPCQAGEAAAQAAPFIPVNLLPHLTGAEPAGDETVDSIPTHVYIFDQRALGAGEQVTASGKVWVAVEGSRVVKYELSLKSEAAFGPGITGEQRWDYSLQDPGADAISLPESCPKPLTDIPVPDGALDRVNLLSEIRYQTGLSQEELSGYYTEQFKAQGFFPQGEAVETSGGTRWVFGKQEAEKGIVVIITAQPSGEGLSVRLVRIITALPPKQQ